MGQQRGSAGTTCHAVAWRGALAGLTAGVVLGLLLKMLQAMTGARVYTLLLNIDFVPIRISELAEFMLHLAVSIPIGIIYFMLLRRIGRHVLLGISIGLISSLTWIPLTLISERVPDWNDFGALLLWLLGHALYGCMLVWFAARYKLGGDDHERTDSYH